MSSWLDGVCVGLGAGALVATFWGVYVRERGERIRNMQRIRWTSENWQAYPEHEKSHRRARADRPVWEMNDVELANWVGARRAAKLRAEFAGDSAPVSPPVR